MKIEKIKSIRVTFEDGVYCNIIPNPQGYTDFWICGNNRAEYMFGTETDSDAFAISLAETNIDNYRFLIEDEE